MFEFVWIASILIFPLPFLVWGWMRPAEFIQSQDALHVPFFKALQKEFGSAFVVPRTWISFLFFMGWCCLVVALMRPVQVGQVQYLPKEARQMMLVLDVSGSMLEQDFDLNGKRMTRLKAVKTVANDFISKRAGDALGIILFGTEPYVYVPLTRDMQTVRQMLGEVEIGIAGDRTAIGDAIGLAVKQMKDLPQKEKVMILLSDGYANAGVLRPEKALELAKELDMKIYTIGIGADKKLVQSFFWVEEVNPSADLDEKLLQQIAKETGGQYFRVKNLNELQAVYDKIDMIEPIEVDDIEVRPLKELFYIPLLVAMGLFLSGLYLKGRRI